MSTFFAPNKTVSQVNTLLKPLTDKLEALGISQTTSVKTSPSFKTAFDGIPSFVDLQVVTFQFGGRIIPKEIFENNKAWTRWWRF